MGDYYLAEQLAGKLGLTVEEIEETQVCGLIQPVHKKGMLFFTSQDAYRLRAACLLRKEKGLSWDEATLELKKWGLYRVTSR